MRPQDCKPTVGTRLNELRKLHGLSFPEIAYILNTTVERYKWCERNQATLNPDQLLKLSSLYQVDLKYLQGRSPSPNEHFKNTGELISRQKKAEQSVADAAFKAKKDAMDDLYKLVNRVKRIIKEDIRDIIKRVTDEDADLLGQTGVELEKEVDAIFTRVVTCIEETTHQYTGGKTDGE